VCLNNTLITEVIMPHNIVSRHLRAAIGADNVTYVAPITRSRVMTRARCAVLAWWMRTRGPKLRELGRRSYSRAIYNRAPQSYITWPFWSRRRKIYYLSGYRAGAKKIASKSGRLWTRHVRAYARIRIYNVQRARNVCAVGTERAEGMNGDERRSLKL